MKYEKLFSPFKIGNVELKNRLVVPAMGTNLCHSDNTISEQLIDYWSARARGGWGLLTVEVTAIDPLGLALNQVPALYDDKFKEGFQKLADEVHKHGAKLCVQLHHAGRQVSSEVIGDRPVAPSPIKCPFVQETPKELTVAEIYDLIEKFGDAALRAKESGVDCVEVHGAHGYLVAQFMSSYSNKRIDEFGGTFENRMRFPVEIIKNIKRKTGNDYPVLFRFSADERVVDGRKIDESRMVARIIEEAGADAIHVSAGAYGSMQYVIPPTSVEPGFIINDAEEIKKSVQVPVITVGRITNPLLAEDALQSGKADLIAMGRQSLADPEFPNKVLLGNEDEIAPCIGCLQGCIGYLFRHDKMRISCLINPFCGKEGEMIVSQAENQKKVVIVGGGPGGLEAAWISAKRGHEVVLFEKENKLGGSFRIGALSPTKQEMLNAITYFKRMGDKYGVSFKMNTEATEENILNEKPDVVILATGAEPNIPNIPGTEQSNVFNANEVLNGEKDPTGKVLIIGGGMVGCETADFLGEYGCDITIAEMLPEIAQDVEASIKYFLLRRLNQYQVEISTDTTVKEIKEDSVLIKKGEKEKKLTGFDSIIIATGYRSCNHLESKLKDKVDIHVIGDAIEARQAIDAIYEGANVAIEL